MKRCGSNWTADNWEGSQKLMRIKNYFIRIPALTFLAAMSLWAKHPKVSKDLDEVDPKAVIDVIVQFNQTPTAVDHDKVAKKGGKLKTDLSLVKTGHYSVQAGALAALADDANVRYISPDREVNGMLDYANPTIFADLAVKQYGFKGKGITVAVLDSGQKNTPDLDELNKIGRAHV